MKHQFRASLEVKSNNSVISTNAEQAEGLHREGITTLSLSANQTHFLPVIPTSKHMISLRASGINREEIFPNDSLAPKDPGRSQMNLVFISPYPMNSMLSTGLTSYHFISTLTSFFSKDRDQEIYQNQVLLIYKADL